MTQENSFEGENVRKIHESINRLLNTKTSLKRKKKSQIIHKKQLFVDIMNGIEELNEIHFRLNQDFGISLDSYYNISLSVIEFALEFYLGKDIVDLIVYYLETKSFPTPDNTTNELLDEDGNPIILEDVDQLWDLIIRLKPEILNEK